MPRPSATGLLTRWPWTTSEITSAALPRQRAASRVESYIYGNILVLAVVAASTPATVRNGEAALLVVGTAVSTFAAHVLALVVTHRTIDEGTSLQESVRDSVPIATSGLLPTVLLVAGWLDWLSPTVAVGVSLASIVVRFVLLGSVASYLDGEKNTWKNVLIGISLAVAGVVVAAIKLVLTH
ncbi:hypothetical protein [uncultured Friedmanniella sp.]|uniref:hypothetical protein n=1 Tax=uncultured Friedmanniella sp. TaxID=335381 RepID=UPI0035CB2F84